ncbi:MAG: UbiA family prenyltransferase [Methanomicrobiales archaeon]|nr:UbiA family prenyltransferase [Methanomicrobiales archaeon]
MFRWETRPDAISGLFESFLDLMLYSSAYLALAAVAMVFIAARLQGIVCTLPMMLVLFLSTYAVYNMNRKTDEVEDAINHADRYAFTKRYEKFFARSSPFAYILALGIAAIYGPFAIAVAALPLVSGILYSSPILPARCGYRRLKEIPFVKNGVIAIAWSITPGVIPPLFAGVSVQPSTWIACGLFCVLAFINSVLFDMRDIAGDREANVRTIPVCLGAVQTRCLLTMVNIVFGAALLLAGFVFLSFWRVWILAAGSIYAQSYIQAFDPDGPANALCDLVADGQFIALGLLLNVGGILGLR